MFPTSILLTKGDLPICFSYLPFPRSNLFLKLRPILTVADGIGLTTEGAKRAPTWSVTS